MRHGVADEAVFRLQVQDVELVDAGRNQQEGALVDLGGQWLVLDELEEIVLEHHSAFGGGDVAADFKQRLVGLAHVALLQVMQQILHALGNALALGGDGLFLGVGVQRQEVARGRSGHPLFNGKTHAGAQLLVAFHGVGQAHQRAAIEQVGRSREAGQRVGLPGIAGKALVLDLQLALHALVPQGSGFFGVLLLQRLQLVGVERQAAGHLRGLRQRGEGRHLTEAGREGLHHLRRVDGLERLQRALPAVC